MATASIEVSGPNAERLAGELQAALVTATHPGDSVSPVEVERSAELVIAIIGLVCSAGSGQPRRSGTAGTVAGRRASRSRSCWMMVPRSICPAWTSSSWRSFSIGERRPGH
jgi:hypothetical protein